MSVGGGCNGDGGSGGMCVRACARARACVHARVCACVPIHK